MSLTRLEREVDMLTIGTVLGALRCRGATHLPSGNASNAPSVQPAAVIRFHRRRPMPLKFARVGLIKGRDNHRPVHSQPSASTMAGPLSKFPIDLKKYKK